jgi:hypothetical protein
MRSSRVAVGEPQQQIAMACHGSAKAQQFVAAEFVEHAQHVMLVTQPASMPGDDGRTIAVDAKIRNGLPTCCRATLGRK